VRITGVRLRRLRYPLDPPFEPAWDPEPRRAFEATLVYVDTDEGLTGIGSGDTMDGFERYAELFLGRDPLDIVRHVRVLETITFHAGRYWPFEAALWDLAGKAGGRPVARLLGGVAESVPAYASTADRRPAGRRADSALALREQGFGALKLRIDRTRLAEGLEAVEATREAVGTSMEIMVDLNQGWRMPGDLAPLLDFDAVDRLAARLEELGVLWLEEPLAGDDAAGLARLRARRALRIAGGEMARTPRELEAWLEADALDVYQPDAVLAVGLVRARELAERVLACGRWFTPHTWTNGIGLLANLHLAAGVGGGPFLELPFDPPGWTPAQRDFMLAEPVLPDAQGRLALPSRPGLGFELDEDAVERYAAA
jgi:L-alanine-DL-glutamate epimerase-like enolase superfamily enzyme